MTGFRVQVYNHQVLGIWRIDLSYSFLDESMIHYYWYLEPSGTSWGSLAVQGLYTEAFDIMTVK